MYSACLVQSVSDIIFYFNRILTLTNAAISSEQLQIKQYILTRNKMSNKESVSVTG